MRPMPILILTLTFMMLSFGASAEENATKPDAPTVGLVLLLSYRDSGIPSDTVRVTIENRSTKPMKIVAPPDISRPWGKDGWWYCGAYQLYLRSPDGRRHRFVCDTPQPPAALPPPKPVIIDLLPGQSMGALFSIGAPSEASPFWREVGKTKQRVQHKDKYTLTAEYDPSYVENNSGPKLAPYAGHKLTSNALDFKVKDTEPHNKAMDSDEK